jgi:hypothetical protein
MNKRFYIALLLVAIAGFSNAQKRDTVIVELAKTSKVIFTIQDKKDIEILKQYDFQKLFQDIINKVEKGDTTALPQKDSAHVASTNTEVDDTYWHKHNHDNDDDEDDDNDDDWASWRENYTHWGKSWQSFNFDLGINNYLSKGKFPDGDNAAYAVKPWGSWYIAANSIQRSRMGKNFFLDWGIGVSWYNFKFDNADTHISKTDNEVVFAPDTRGYNYMKSKLMATYVNASFIPVLDFSDHNKKHRLWDNKGESFRIGLGPYIGYRIGSHSKMVYKDHGPREKDKDHDNFYLNNLRYGARLQVGFRSTDLFFNYDMNQLFSHNKGPNLNAFSFGIVF